MQAILNAITEELARLKADGEMTVPVSDATLDALRAMVRARGAVAQPARAEGGAVGPIAVSPGAAVLSVAVAPVNPLRAEREAAAKGRMGVPVPAPVAAIPSLPPPPVVILPDGDKAARWAALTTLMREHPVCVARVRSGQKLVAGAGALDAKVFLVGDAPGEEEEAAGEPFAGPAGELLTKMLKGMGLSRETVHISYLVCWRPTVSAEAGADPSGSRPPSAEEIAFCRPFLQAAMDIVQPKLVVALGATAAQGLLGASFTTLPEVRGRWLDFGGRPLLVTYHPNYLLRSASNRSKRAVWEDLLKVMERAGLPISERQRGFFL